MKQNVSLAVLLLAWLAGAGCAGQIPTLGGSEADGGPPETKPPEERTGTAGSANGENGPNVAVVAACAASGAPVDLVAEGTVEEVTVREGSSLAEFRVDRVLEGHAGGTVSVRTSSGTGAVSEYVPHFEEGDRCRLHLQRQGDVSTTNVCLGTRQVE